MYNEKVCFVYEAKEGKKYIETYRNEDEKEVYERLSHELIAKKINNCTYIRSIKRCNLYNGFEQIYVYYDHGGKGTYTIKN